MNIASREFEKRFRSLHRAELAASPELAREFKRARKSDSAGLARMGRKMLLPIFWVVIPASLMMKGSHFPLGLAVLSLWTAGSAFRWGQHWFQQFYGSEDLMVLSHLPLNDEQIFGFQKRRFLRSFGWVLWELLVAYGVLAIFPAESRPPFYILATLAAAQVVLIFAMALHLASYLHFLPLGMIGGLLRTTAVVVLIWGINSEGAVQAVVTASHWIFPTGWLNYLTYHSVVGRDHVVLALLVPVAALVFAGRYSWARLRSLYSLEGLEVMPGSLSGAEADQEELTDQSFGPRRGPTEVEDSINERLFLQAVNWETAGRLERFVSRMLTARQRTVAEFLVAANPGWTRSLKFAVVLWVIACLVVILFGNYSGTVVFFSAYILGTASLPLFGGDWRGLRQTPNGGVFIAGYSAFPIAFNEVASVLFKVNLIRILAAFPLLLSFSALAGQKLGYTVLQGCSFALEVFGIVLVLQPLLILLPISKTTNDTSRIRTLWLMVFLPILVLLVGGIATVFFAETIASRFLLYVGMLALSAIFFAVYRRAYRKGRFDLVTRRLSDEA